MLGCIVRLPVGGRAWADLHFLLALRKLGHEVYFLEDSDVWTGFYDPVRNVVDPEPSYGLKFLSTTLERVGLGDRWAFHDARKGEWFGPCGGQMVETCKKADVVINLAGRNPLRPWLRQIPVRVFLDKDPAFTQIAHLRDNAARELALEHNAFFSLGANLGLQGCAVPDDGLPWQFTPQPIFLEAWPSAPSPKDGKFTTVMQWESYSAVEHEGRSYGLKAQSFPPYIDLPARAAPIFELAVGSPKPLADVEVTSPTAPREFLREKGWGLENSLSVTRDPWTYQRYIQQSRAEFTVAKHGYVITHCGWFSERSALYLATGRPVLTQETGFSRWLEAGAGVVPFSSPEEAVAGFEAIQSRYEFHSQTAREIAVEYFDSRKMIPRLLERAIKAAQLGAQLPEQCERT